jgi:hypothetical protein
LAGESPAFALATFDSATSIRWEFTFAQPPSQTPYVPRQNKTARLNHPSGCMTAAACHRDIPVIQRLLKNPLAIAGTGR